VGVHDRQRQQHAAQLGRVRRSGARAISAPLISSPWTAAACRRQAGLRAAGPSTRMSCMAVVRPREPRWRNWRRCDLPSEQWDGCHRPASVS
jgi:hypothetical protein